MGFIQHIILMVSLEDKLNITIENSLISELTSYKKIKSYILRGRDTKNIMDTKGKEKSTEFSDKKIQRGLANVIFDNSSISYIDGPSGKLKYRGYSIDDLVEFSTFEEVAFLLLFGEIPNKNELFDFLEELKNHRLLPEYTYDIIFKLKDYPILEALRTIISILECEETSSSSKNLNIGIKLIAQIPTLLTFLYSYKTGKEIIKPNRSLTHTENFLYMLTGEKPSKEIASIIDKILILHAEHGSNASTFSARVTIGTQASIYSSIISAISTFSGKIHGGAVKEVMDMLLQIKEPQNVNEYLTELIRETESIKGFGHRLYKVQDPRSLHLKKYIEHISIIKNDNKQLMILQEIEKFMSQYNKQGLNVNVDFYTGSIYKLLGIPSDLYVPIFVMSRIVGWVSHITEQLENNILIRPLLNYTGEKNKKYNNKHQSDNLSYN